MYSFNRFLATLLFAASLVAIAGWNSGTAQDAKPKAVQQWEYEVTGNPRKGYLKEAGEQGWELVTVVRDGDFEKIYYFKRPK